MLYFVVFSHVLLWLVIDQLDGIHDYLYFLQEPFECYRISDVEAGLGLKRKHLIAISLLVGNDHDLNGVQGIGLDTALRFVKCFSEDEILTRFDLLNWFSCNLLVLLSKEDCSLG